MRTLLYTALFLLYLFHNDIWLWNYAELVWGLPAGLAYHVAYCFAAAFLMALLVRHAWPDHLGTKNRRPPAADGDSSPAG
jgi:hypothetical protein